MKITYFTIALYFALSAHSDCKAQIDTNAVLTLDQAFNLAVKNSVQLKISEQSTALAAQKVNIQQLDELPKLSTSLDYGYLSNSEIWTPSFSKHSVEVVPHDFSQFAFIASETIYKGGEVKNNFQKATLEHQVAMLNQDKDIVDIKFLVAARYLDIYRLINRRRVLENNTRLAKERYKNILIKKKQGMVTNNDVLRTQITISDLELAARKTDNSISILNHELNMVLGLDAAARLKPDTTLIKSGSQKADFQNLLAEAYRKNQGLKIAKAGVQIAATDLKLIGADRYPEISLIALDNFNRPYTDNIPVLDIFYNFYVAGIRIKYNISSVYQSPRKRAAGKIQLAQRIEKETLQRQQLEVEVNTAYTSYKEAQDELHTYLEDQRSAEENYRIVEKKYFNQLALLTDIIDATNTKIEAELNVTNAEINVIFTNYQILKTIGSL